MFREVTLRGTGGAIIWGYRDGATLGRWVLHRLADRTGWRLTAVVEWASPTVLAHTPLLFTAARAGGRWCFPVVEVHVQGRDLTATLGAPEY